MARIPARAKGREALAWAMSEAELQDNCIRLAWALGLLVSHNSDSRRSYGKGYPDLHICPPARPGQERRPGGQLCWELKEMGKEPDPDQRVWLRALAGVGARIAVIRPTDWFSGLVERELYELAGKTPPRQIPVDRRFAERALLGLRTTRMVAGVRQTDLGRRLGLPQRRVDEIENDARGLDVDLVARIQKVLADAEPAQDPTLRPGGGPGARRRGTTAAGAGRRRSQPAPDGAAVRSDPGHGQRLGVGSAGAQPGFPRPRARRNEDR